LAVSSLIDLRSWLAFAGHRVLSLSDIASKLLAQAAGIICEDGGIILAGTGRSHIPETRVE
jgi:hypothetical protein